MHQDIITLIKQSETDNSLPTVILGHSMGGGLVTSLFINNQYIQVHGNNKYTNLKLIHYIY